MITTINSFFHGLRAHYKDRHQPYAKISARWIAAFVAILLSALTLRPALAADFARNYATSSTISFVNGTATDAAGNVYIGGYFFGSTMAVGTTTLTKIGSTDLFVAKLDTTGTVLWAKNFGGAGANSQVNALAIDGTGNVYIAGFFNGANYTSPAMTKIGTQDAFAMKLDTSGNVTWAKNFGGAGATAQALAVSVDGSGNVYMGGLLQAADMTTPVVPRIGTRDAFAFKLDSTGAVTWAKNFGGAGATAQTNGIAVDGSGSVYMAGFFQSANLTTPALTKIGSQDAFAFKLDSSGATTWSKNFGGAGANVQNAGVTVDGSGNVYLAGTLNTASMTTPALARIGSRDALTFKLDSTGAITWVKNFGGAGANANGIGVALDGLGSVYMVGHFFGADFTTPAFTKIGSTDMFAVKLDATGTTTWSKNYGGPSVNIVAAAISVDSAGNLALGGFFQSGNLTTPALSEIGADDAYIIRQSTVLGAPAIGTATAGSLQATVTFTAPALDGGFPITGYTVTSNPAGGVDSNAGTTGLSHVVTGLANGTTYTFTVTASNVNGPGLVSAASNSVTFGTPVVAPAIPETVVVVTGLNLPPVLNMSAGSGPKLLADVVTLLSNALGQQLSFVEQTTNGTVVLSGFNGNNIAFLPLSFQTSDQRANGIYAMGNGQFAAVSNGLSLTMAPALVHIEQLLTLLPGLSMSGNSNGSIIASYNGIFYVAQPDFVVQRRPATGAPQLTTDADGTLRFTDSFGNSQLLGAAFLSPATVRSILQSLDLNATLVVQQNGTATVVVNGLRLTLVPDLILGALSTDRIGQSWWQESPTRYRVANGLLQPGTTQGVTAK